MNINPETVYAGIAIAFLFTGPAYILWDSVRSKKSDLREWEIRRKYMSGDGDLDDNTT
jgi:hypothetical protein